MLVLRVQRIEQDGVAILFEDQKFFKRMVQELVRSAQAYVWRQYKVVWLAAMEGEPDGIKKQNAGRRAANKWLREEGVEYAHSMRS